MANEKLILALNENLALSLPGKVSYAELKSLLSLHLNHLIKTDFDKLVAYLYRIDVSEEKLKVMLQQHSGEDAGNIIAALIIERQEQKLKTRQQFGRRDNDINEEEKW